MKRGRKSIFAHVEKAEWDDIRNRIIYGSTEWRIIKLRQLIGDGSQLAENCLSARKAHNQAIAAEKRHVLLDEIDSLWRELSAQWERAVLNGDHDWFKRQCNAMKKGGTPQRAWFNAKVVHLLEMAMWGTRATEDDNREDLTLTPAGKFTDVMASDIWKAVVNAALEEHETRLLIEEQLAAGKRLGLRKPKRQTIEQVVAEIYGFKIKERAMDAIHDLAKQLQFALKKQGRKR